MISMRPSEEPALAGFIVTGITGLAAHWGLTIDAELKTAIVTVVGAVVTLLVRHHVTPNVRVAPSDVGVVPAPEPQPWQPEVKAPTGPVSALDDGADRVLPPAG